MIQPKVKPKMRTLTVSLPESVLAALDEYCRFLGADTDRTYIVSGAAVPMAGVTEASFARGRTWALSVERNF